MVLSNSGFPDPPRLTSAPRSFTDDIRSDAVRYAGRERYADMTPEQRSENLARIVELASKGIGDDREFARGWLDELQLARSAC